MKDSLYQILRWRDFTRIDHPGLPLITKTMPNYFALGGAFVIVIFGVKLTGDGGLARGLGGIFAQLPGFFVAALAAVATFDKRELDDVIKNPAANLPLRTAGKEEGVDLTLRMFLSFLFAYLSAVSLLSAIACAFGEASAPNFLRLISIYSDTWLGIVALGVKFLYALFLVWMTAKITLIALFGMYFLAERIHRPSA